MSKLPSSKMSDGQSIHKQKQQQQQQPSKTGVDTGAGGFRQHPQSNDKIQI